MNEPDTFLEYAFMELSGMPQKNIVELTGMHPDTATKW
jgi:hypothetical protein